MLGEEVLYGILEHFTCISEIPFEECTSYIEGSSLWSKVVFVDVCTGGKSLSDFCKGISTTVEEAIFYDEKGMVNVSVMQSYGGCRVFRQICKGRFADSFC